MKKISLQSKSFIFLFGLAVVGVYLCLMLWVNLKWNSHYNSSTSQGYGNYQVIPYGDKTAQKAPAQDKIVPVDTSAWPTYTNEKYGLSFKYNPDWKVIAPKTQNGFVVIQIDPGKKYYNFKIYVSTTEFFALGGVPITHETIGGADALNVENLLYGIKAGTFYYTFDIGNSVMLEQDFNGLVHSVQFNG